jgi:hypothetical protein
VPISLSTPVTKTGGEWKIRSFMVFDAEFDNPSIRIELECVAVDGTVVDQLSGTLTFASWVSTFNGIGAGTNIARLRRSILIQAQTEFSSKVGAGSAT